MNIDDYERNNQKASQCHDWDAETGASQQQITNKEELARSWEVSRYVHIFVVC